MLKKCPFAKDCVSRMQCVFFQQKSELEQLLSLLKKTESLTEEQLARLSVLMSDFRTALTRVQPSAKREGFATVPDVTWDDVGALQDIREELNMAIMVKLQLLKYHCTVAQFTGLQ